MLTKTLLALLTSALFAVAGSAAAQEQASPQPSATSQAQTFMVEGGGDLPIAVTVSGNPDGPALVFIHSLMGNSTIWRKQFASELGETYRLVALDIRGHGSSARPMAADAYTDTKLFADDIAAAIDAANIEKPTLVAWAYGGLFAIDYIRHYGSEAVAGLIIAEGNGGFEALPPPEDTPEYRARIARAGSIELPVIEQWTREFGEYLMRAGPLPPEEAESIRTMAMMTPHWVRNAMRDRPTDNSDLVADFDVPVLFVSTITEGFGYELLSRVADRLPNARIATIPTGGSLSFWYQPDDFNAELIAFTK